MRSNRFFGHEVVEPGPFMGYLVTLCAVFALSFFVGKTNRVKNAPPRNISERVATGIRLRERNFKESYLWSRQITV